GGLPLPEYEQSDRADQENAEEHAADDQDRDRDPAVEELAAEALGQARDLLLGTDEPNDPDQSDREPDDLERHENRDRMGHPPKTAKQCHPMGTEPQPGSGGRRRHSPALAEISPVFPGRKRGYPGSSAAGRRRSVHPSPTRRA